MFNLTVLLLVITPMLVSSEMRTRRMLEGIKAPNRSVPYQVSLRKSGVGHFCGGSVITPGAILTAAHCVEGTKPELLEVVVGTNQRSAGGQSYSIRKIVAHERYEEREPDENYKKRSYVNDIAIVFTDEEIQFSDNVYAVELNDEPVRAGEELLLTGWGYTSVCLFCSDKPLTEATPSTPNRNNYVYLGHSPTDLMQLKVEAVSHEDCKTAFEDSIPIFKTQICAMAEGGNGACCGDSGGPLVEVKGGRQVGIVSRGLPSCTGKPDVYTSVHSFIPWIDKKLLENDYYDDNDYQDDDSDDYIYTD